MNILCHWVKSVRVESDEIAGETRNFFRTKIIIDTDDGRHTIDLFPKKSDEPLVIEIGEVKRLGVA